MRRRLVPLAGATTALLLLAAPAAAAGRSFDNPSSHDTSQQFGVGSAGGNVQRDDTPNDPGYDAAEPDDPDGGTATSLYDEQFGLFGFPSERTRTTTTYRAGPNAGKPQISGFNAAGAWKATRGRADVTIAILDTGIKWDRPSIRDQIRLNQAELPKPELAGGATAASYDANGNGRLDVDDYAQDPRVTKTGPNGLPTAEDLIRVFSDGTDADHNGYVDDIAGWDFFDNDNDPYDASSYFAAANHGTGRADNAAEVGNDGAGGLGVCPECTILPIRTWDTFVSDGNTFGMGMLYAADNGAAVIEGANGSVYHSAFAEAASQYAYDRGVLQVYSGDDLNTANHNYAGNYGHAMLIQGTVPDTVGLGQSLPPDVVDFYRQLGLTIPVGTDLPVGTYFRGANTTQWGGKSSLSMEGTTGSENTAKAAGAAGLVISAARAAGVALAPDEARELLEQTAEDVLPENTGGTGAPDLSQSGWDPHFGYGRANVGAAVSAAVSTKLPAQAAIDGPDWYAPVTGPAVALTGRLQARDAPGGCFHYQVEWGPGLAPTSWQPVSAGDSCGAVTALGTLDLGAIRTALVGFHSPYGSPTDPGAPVFNPSEPGPFDDQFAVRVTASYAGQAVPGVDRRVFTAIPDGEQLLPGFPRKLGSESGQLRYADINGNGTQELLVPTEDGLVHAFEPDGSELPGWPVRTQPMFQAAGHDAAPGFAALAARGVIPREPPRGTTVADLDGDGTQEIVDVAGTHLYVWEPDGSLRPGFPVQSDFSFCGPATESQPLHHPKCGFFAAPALGRLQGGATLEIVEAALDGHLYAWDPAGQLLSGYPRQLLDTSVPPDKRMVAESINEVAIGDVNGDGKDDIVAADNEEYGADPAVGDVAGGFSSGLADLLASAAGGSTRVYAIDGPTGAVLPGWPVSLNGAIQNVLPLIGPGQDPAILSLNGAPVVVASSTGGALSEYRPDGTLIRSAQQSGLNLFESAAIGDLTGSGSPALVKYELGLSGVANLAAAGQNFAYSHFEGAWDTTTGAPLPKWPQIIDDFQFTSASNIAQLVPGTSQQVLLGDGLGLLHAFDGVTGLDVAGFPKVTGGWLLVPPALSADGRVAAVDREGYLFSWGVPDAPACQSEWPSFRHDQQGSGHYGRDGTPPGAPQQLTLTPQGGNNYTLAFTSPGDDRYCGTGTSYVAEVDGQRVDLGLGSPVAGGTAVSRTVTLPAGARTLRLWEVDEVTSAGPAATASLEGAPGAVVPEAPYALLLPLVAAGLLAAGLTRRRRA